MAPIAYSYRNHPAIPVFPDDHPIVIYDGKCRMCSGVRPTCYLLEPGQETRFLG